MYYWNLRASNSYSKGDNITADFGNLRKVSFIYK